MRLKNKLELRQLSPKTYILEVVDGLHDDFNKIVTFNSSAAFLWKSLCEQDFSVSDVVYLLTEEYGIGEDTAKEDAQSLINDWREASLIEG